MSKALILFSESYLAGQARITRALEDNVAGNRLILHIGAPKCASSSIQIALSRRPDFSSSVGERFRYVAISNEADILTGEPLRRYAASSACRYVVSADGNTLAGMEDAQIEGIAHHLRALLAESSVILSCESWISTAQAFQDIRLLERIPYECEAVAYVRPQSDFINACWWQWSAWTDVDFDVWLYFSGFGNTCAWADFLRSWSTIDGVSRVGARLMSKDVLPNFFSNIGCDFEANDRINRSLPEVALRFLQRNRDLRQNMHDSDIDFTLERALGNWSEPPPWVMPIEFVTALIERSRTQNEALMEMLSATDRSAMLADPRWWNSSFYRDRRVVSASGADPDPGQMDALAVSLATALQRAEQTIAALKNDIS